MASLFTGLLGNQGGGTPTATLSIAYTQDSQIVIVTGNAKASSAIAYTQADSVTSVAANAKDSSVIGYIQDSQTVAIAANGKASGAIGYTQADQVTTITANAGSATNILAISYTQYEQVTAISATELQEIAQSRGGFSPTVKARKFKKSDKDEIVNAIRVALEGDAVSEAQIVEVVAEVTKELKPRDFVSEIAQYEYAIEKTRAILQKIIDAETDDEETILLLM